MLHLRHHIIVIGPDRCWKTSLIREMRKYYVNDVYKGYRGDDEIVESLFSDGVKRFWDRGLICDRAYNELLGRSVTNACVKERVERSIAESSALYIHMTRQSFEGVRDDVNPNFDLGELSNIYFKLLRKVPNLVHTIYVDEVQQADLNTDPYWLDVVANAMSFVREFN